jgi:hypothetical protein
MFNTLSNVSYARPASSGGRKEKDLEMHNITTIYSQQGDAEEREFLNSLVDERGTIFDVTNPMHLQVFDPLNRKLTVTVD